jgi:hypothetical protein
LIFLQSKFVLIPVLGERQAIVQIAISPVVPEVASADQAVLELWNFGKKVSGEN